MRIRMKVTKQGFNGRQQFCYRMGQVYTLAPLVAREYIARGWAIEDKAIEVTETKKPRGRKKKAV